MLRSVRRLVLVAAFAASTGIASAQTAMDTPAAMPASTMPPKAPKFPLPPKPDFSSMTFLLGSWTCKSYSERRGGEATTVNSVTTMSPDGYSMKTVSKSPKVSYAATGFTTTDWVTYDSRAGRWIDITVGSFGAYGYSTSTGWSHGQLLWGADSFLPDGDVTSSTGTVMTKISDTKYTTGSAFTTTAGLVNRVHGTCIKN
jgi:hypothetical protein